VVQQILAWHNDGMSQRAIAKKLNEEHVSTISGRGTWNSGQVAKLLAKER
jgi:IS30 family transposase